MVPYYATYQMVQPFNYNYKDNFDYGWEVTVDERILWGWARDQPGGGHKVDKKPRGFRTEYKCLSAVGPQVLTTFEHERSKKVNDKKKYTNKYGAGAAFFLRLCEDAGIEGSNRFVIVDSWFIGIRYVIGLSKLGFRAITMIKTGTAGYRESIITG